MKTRSEVEALKKNWLGDPCWDIYETEGYEEYREELRIFQINMMQAWRAKEYNRIYARAQSLGIDDLGPKDDEPDLRLAQYLEGLEARIKSLESTIDRLTC